MLRSNWPLCRSNQIASHALTHEGWTHQGRANVLCVHVSIREILRADMGGRAN